MAAITEATNYDWSIASTEESRNSDALTAAINDVDKLSQVTGARTQAYDDNFIMLYESKGHDDLFTASNLQKMCELESVLVHNDEFVDFCQLDSNSSCILSSSSLVVYFYDFDSLESWNCSLLSSGVVASKSNAIYSVMDTPAGQEQYGYWLSADAVDRGYTTMAQSLWTLGAPLDGYETPTTKEQTQVRSSFVLV